jgi:hypothetical protein
MAGSLSAKVTPAPGGMMAPHAPGMLPDWTRVPTHVGEQTPPAVDKLRPLTQYGTAEEMLGVFRQKPMDQLEPADFEQAPASPEEMRHADPALLTPIRPLAALEYNLAIDPGQKTPELTTGE